MNFHSDLFEYSIYKLDQSVTNVLYSALESQTPIFAAHISTVASDRVPRSSAGKCPSKPFIFSSLQKSAHFIETTRFQVPLSSHSSALFCWKSFVYSSFAKHTGGVYTLVFPPAPNVVSGSVQTCRPAAPRPRANPRNPHAINPLRCATPGKTFSLQRFAKFRKLLNGSNRP